jgi:hypothetical protein
MGQILGGSLCTSVSKADEVTGKFIGHRAGKSLLRVEEAFFAGDRSAEGALKHLITSETVQIQRKYADTIEHPNYVRLLITSNADWVVPAGVNERRFAVLNVSEVRRNDLAYFGALRRQAFEKGGCARFLAYLRDEVVVDRDAIRRPPSTAALLEQQLNSLAAPDRWLFDLLSEGALPLDSGGKGVTLVGALFDSYSSSLRAGRNPYDATREKMGRLLRDRLGDLVSSRRPRDGGGERLYAYQFAPLDECRSRFAARFSQTPSWENDASAWQSDRTAKDLGIAVPQVP